MLIVREFSLLSACLISASVGVRAQVAILTVVVMLIFGYIWIALVRIAIGLFMKIGVIQHADLVHAPALRLRPVLPAQRGTDGGLQG